MTNDRHASMRALRIVSTRRSNDIGNGYQSKLACTRQASLLSAELAFQDIDAELMITSNGIMLTGWQSGIKAISCNTCKVLLDAALEGRNPFDDLEDF